MCPDPEIVAAFVDGNTSAEERSLLITHLAVCDTCLIEIHDTLRCESEEQVHVVDPVPSRSDQPRRAQAPPRHRRWLSVATAALIVAAFSVTWSSFLSRDDSMALLVAAARDVDRPIEPRLSGGFTYRPLRKAYRGASAYPERQSSLTSAAAAVIQRAETDHSQATKHAAAIAHIFAGNTAEGTQLLKELAIRTNHPAVLADLAAALYVQGVETSTSAYFVEALAAADAAMRRHPDLPEALFNRALIIERLDGRSAEAEWRRYLAVDTSTPWAVEARDHLRRLGEQTDGAIDDMDAFAALRTALGDDEIVLRYRTLSAHLETAVSSRAGTFMVTRAVRRETLARAIAALTDSVRSGNDSRFLRASSTLYDQLITPVAGELKPGRRLIIITDAMLEDVPFAALRSPDGRYLIESHPIVVTSSASAYVQSLAHARVATEPPRLLLIGGPSYVDATLNRLFFAGRELDAVASVYGDVERHATADADALQSHSGNADVIHFAGHALTPQGTNEPALVTFGRGGGPAYVTASEIAQLHLTRTRVVVLAGCRTRHAGGRLSLAEAFLAAGTPSVIGTLWDIDDRAASEFYPRLHQYLARGLPPADALRAAQLEWIRRGNAPVRIWAAVQAIGA